MDEKELSYYLMLVTSSKEEDLENAYRYVLDAATIVMQKSPSNLPKKFQTLQINDAFILLQMVVAKGMGILELLDGVSYKNRITNITAQKIVDPTPIAVLTRTQFEAYSTFSNIYNTNNDLNTRDFLHTIWVLAGLNERQRGEDPTKPELLAKKKKEKQDIEDLINKLKQNPKYLNLTPEKQKNVDDWISKRKYEVTFRNGKLVLLSQRDFFLNSGVNEKFSNLYAILSWYVHPTYVSVLQFSQMFNQNTNTEHTYSMLKISRIIISLFLTEYCKLLPPVFEEFKTLPDLNQLIVYTDNKTFRGNDDFHVEAMDRLNDLISKKLNMKK
nr:DUF5677 domain-containing protein [uncultured Fluviicola sp.]